jgi:hypothetical protein
VGAFLSCRRLNDSIHVDCFNYVKGDNAKGIDAAKLLRGGGASTQCIPRRSLGTRNSISFGCVVDFAPRFADNDESQAVDWRWSSARRYEQRRSVGAQIERVEWRTDNNTPVLRPRLRATWATRERY